MERLPSSKAAFGLAIFSTSAGIIWRLPEGGAGRRKLGCALTAAAAACGPEEKQDEYSVLGPSLNLKTERQIQIETKPRHMNTRGTCSPKNRSNAPFCPSPCATT